MTDHVVQQTSDQSADVSELFSALSAFQGEVSSPTKNAINPHFKNSYADLGEVLTVARPVLAKHGLAIAQTTGVYGSVLMCVTTLGHKSGQWLRGYWPIEPQRRDPQGYGSALTYARRYGASAMLGLAAKDDDGEAAVERSDAPTNPQPSQSDIAAMVKAYADIGMDEHALENLVGGPLREIGADEFEGLRQNYKVAARAQKKSAPRTVNDIVKERQ